MIRTLRLRVTPLGFTRLFSAAFASIAATFGSAGHAQTSWNAACTVDAMSDSLVCNATDAEMNVAVFFDGKGNVTSVCALRHDFPGVAGAIRVDRGAAVDVEPPIPCSRSPKLVRSVLKGKIITTRHMAFPVRAPIDKTTAISGLKEAIAQAIASR